MSFSTQGATLSQTVPAIQRPCGRRGTCAFQPDDPTLTIEQLKMRMMNGNRNMVPVIISKRSFTGRDLVIGGSRFDWLMATAKAGLTSGSAGYCFHNPRAQLGSSELATLKVTLRSEGIIWGRC